MLGFVLLGMGDDLPDNGITTGSSFTIDYGTGPDLTPAQVLDAQQLVANDNSRSSIPDASSSGFNWNSILSGAGNLLGSAARALTGQTSPLGSQQYLAAQAAANAQRTNTLLLVGGLAAAAGLGYVFLRRRRSS
jgi:LPXTG-motif cell wall-anchored protein